MPALSRFSSDLGRSLWFMAVLAFIAGYLTPFSLAPYDYWLIGIASATGLMLLLRPADGKKGFWLSFLFGVGLYTKGASWVYVAINDFGFTSPVLALILTSIFVLGLALVFAFPFYLYCRFFNTTTLSSTLGFSAVWVLGEWSRSWFLTGFPWLYLGYAHVDTWLSGWAPIFGVFGLSFIAVLSGTSLTTILINKKGKLPTQLAILGSIALLWCAGKMLHYADWRKPGEASSHSVAIVQPNIPLEVKWNPLFLEDTLSILREHTDKHWDKDIILWPEAAVPLMYHEAQGVLEEIHEKALATDTGLITGILYDDAEPGVFYNSIIGLGHAEGIYFKQRLVPFGEYVPLEKWLRGLIAFFNLPNSVIFPGPSNQEVLSYQGKLIAPSVCYEIVYPDLVAKLAERASMLVTISNDAWFGDSIGPVQHFQMARMRALENQLYVIRSTNTGISGIIDPKGEVSLLGKQFIRESIALDDIQFVEASTPFSRFKSWPIVIFAFLLLTCIALIKSRQRQKLMVNLPG